MRKINNYDSEYRTNITFLNGEPGNGKSTWLYNMLNKRKEKYIEKRKEDLKTKFLAEQETKIKKQLNLTVLTKDDKESLLDFFDTYSEWVAFQNFIQKNPDSEMGYGCHVISLKKIEKELYPEGYCNREKRDKVIQELIKEIWETMFPKCMVEYMVFAPGEEPASKQETMRLYPPNIFVDGTLDRKECRRIITELRSKARSKFITCYYTCFNYIEEPKRELTETEKFIKTFCNFPETKDKDVWNSICSIGPDGCIEREVYSETRLL